MELTGTDYAMQQWIDKLDSLNVEYEARWGVSVLHTLVPDDLRQKWGRQIEKINAAISTSDLFVMPELFEGTRRGYEALEAAAIKAGHKPHGAPVAWTVRMPCGKELAICATRHDAARLQGNKRSNIPLEIWTLEEIANFISAKGVLTNLQPVKAAQPAQRGEFDFVKGDEIVF